MATSTQKIMAELATPATATNKVGYYEDVVTRSVHAEAGLSVWVPLQSSFAGPLHGPYTFNCSARKLFRNFGGIDTGLLSDEKRFELPSIAYSATSKDAASPRGIVVYCHGVACTRWDLWKLAEELASEGYIVAAPGFANSSANDRKDMMGTYGGGMPGGGLVYESLVLRMHTMECVREHLFSVFGQLPLGMVGHSMGAETINLLNWDVPKCMISGGSFGPDGVAVGEKLYPWGSPESGRSKPIPVTQGSASLVLLSKSGDMFFPDVCQSGFTFDKIDLADEEPSSVPQGELPQHCMVRVDGIDHTTWLIDMVEHVFKKIAPFDTLYEKVGVDVFGNYAPSKQRGQKLNDNVIKPLIKRFFAKNLVVGKEGKEGKEGSKKKK